MSSNAIHQMLRGRKRKRSGSPHPPSNCESVSPPGDDHKEAPTRDMTSTPNDEITGKALAPPSLSKRRRLKQIQYYRKCFRANSRPTRFDPIPPASGEKANETTFDVAVLLALVWVAKAGESNKMDQYYKSPIYQGMSRYYQQLRRESHAGIFRMQQLENQNRELANDYRKEKKQKRDLEKKVLDLEKYYQTIKEKHSALKLRLTRAHKKQVKLLSASNPSSPVQSPDVATERTDRKNLEQQPINIPKASNNPNLSANSTSKNTFIQQAQANLLNTLPTIKNSHSAAHSEPKKLKANDRYQSISQQQQYPKGCQTASKKGLSSDPSSLDYLPNKESKLEQVQQIVGQKSKKRQEKAKQSQSTKTQINNPSTSLIEEIQHPEKYRDNYTTTNNVHIRNAYASKGASTPPDESEYCLQDDAQQPIYTESENFHRASQITFHNGKTNKREAFQQPYMICMPVSSPQLPSLATNQTSTIHSAPSSAKPAPDQVTSLGQEEQQTTYGIGAAFERPSVEIKEFNTDMMDDNQTILEKSQVPTKLFKSQQRSLTPGQAILRRRIQGVNQSSMFPVSFATHTKPSTRNISEEDSVDDSQTILDLPPALTTMQSGSRRVTMSPHQTSIQMHSLGKTTAPGMSRAHTSTLTTSDALKINNHSKSDHRRRTSSPLPDAVPSAINLPYPNTSKNNPLAQNTQRISTSPNSFPKKAPCNQETAFQDYGSEPLNVPQSRKTSLPIANSRGWVSTRSNRSFLQELDSNGQRKNTNSKKSIALPSNVPQSKASFQKHTSTSTKNPSKFRYQEVVRKKADREQLRAFDCPDCAKFLEAIREGRGAEVFDRDDIAQCSRHRAMFTPPETPDGFWELSFPDERETHDN